MKNKKYLTATNILILIIVICYVLDRYIIPIPNGYNGFTWASMVDGESDTIFKVLGFCGGRLTNLLAILGPELNPNGHMFYRYVTLVFTHAFILHIVVNMIGLYFIGNYVERKLGSKLTILLFFLIGTIEAIITDPIYLLFNPGYDMSAEVCAGASGAIFGLMGVGLVICLFNKDKFKSMKLSHIIVLAIYGVVFTYLANDELISWTTFAHNDGLIIGIIVMLILYFASDKIKKKVKSKN